MTPFLRIIKTEIIMNIHALQKSGDSGKYSYLHYFLSSINYLSFIEKQPIIFIALI